MGHTHLVLIHSMCNLNISIESTHLFVDIFHTIKIINHIQITLSVLHKEVWIRVLSDCWEGTLNPPISQIIVYIQPSIAVSTRKVRENHSQSEALPTGSAFGHLSLIITSLLWPACTSLKYTKSSEKWLKCPV